jgi:glucose dehydrogenase
MTETQKTRSRMRNIAQLTIAAAAAALLGSGCASSGGSAPAMTSTGQGVAGMTGDRIVNGMDREPGNWMSYHGDYKSWHYSPLEQINTGNVGNLKEAWSHVASRANRGLQGFPLVIDGVLYYSSPYNQLYALDGATGEMIWTYKQNLNEDLVARQTHSPYNRGIAAGFGNIYMGTLDGKLVAVDAKTGKLNWETKLVDSEKLTVGFTGAPLLVKDKVIIGRNSGTSTPPAAMRAPSPMRATPGGATPTRWAAAAAGCRAATIRIRTLSGGPPRTRRRCTTWLVTTGRRKVRAPAQTSIRPPSSCSTRIPAS